MVKILQHFLLGFVVEEEEGVFLVTSLFEKGDAPVLPWQELENAEVAAVVANILGQLVICLGEVDHATVAVPPVKEVADDLVLVLLTDQVVRDHNLLIVHREFVEWQYIIPWCFKRVIPNLIADFLELSHENLVLVLMKVLRKEVDFVKKKAIPSACG